MTRPPNEPIRVILVDSDPVFRAGLLPHFAHVHDIDILKCVSSALEAIAYLEAHQTLFDLILTDVRLRGDSGFHICRHLHKQHIIVKVAFITAQYTDEAIIWARHMRADGYVRKDAEPHDLVDSVRTICDGSYQWPTTSLDSQLCDGRNRILTSTEEVIFWLLVKANMKPQQIAEFLHRSDDTILNHKRSIMNKLGVKDSIALGKYEFLLDH